jgi:hypothetical protein
MRLEEEYLKHIANLNPKKVSLGQQFANNLRNELMSSIPKGIAGMIENAIKNAGNSNPKNDSKTEDKKKEKPVTTKIAGVNPEKLDDKALAAYNERLRNINTSATLREAFDSEMTKKGEEFMKDYWVSDKEKNMTYKLVERELADQSGVPLNPDDIRRWIEKKN